MMGAFEGRCRQQFGWALARCVEAYCIRLNNAEFAFQLSFGCIDLLHSIWLGREAAISVCRPSSFNAQKHSQQRAASA